MRQSLKETADYMADYVNQSCKAVNVTVGSFVWLSTAHLRLPAKLSCKLAAKWAGPFKDCIIGRSCFILVRVAGWLVPTSCFSCQLTETSGWLFWGLCT